MINQHQKDPMTQRPTLSDPETISEGGQGNQNGDPETATQEQFQRSEEGQGHQNGDPETATQK